MDENKRQDMEARILHSWEVNAAAWTNTIEKQLIASRKLATDKAIVDVVLEGKPSRILDVGCGEGWLSRKLAGEGIQVLGIDGSEALIQRAKAAGGADFSVLSYEKMIAQPDTIAGEYDCIVCNFSLLGENLVPLLKAMNGRLAKNGRLIVQTVHPLTAVGEGTYENGWRTENFSAFEEKFPASMPWYFRTIGSWFEQIAAADLVANSVREPLHPDTGMPLSLLFVLRARS